MRSEQATPKRTRAERDGVRVIDASRGRAPRGLWAAALLGIAFLALWFYRESPQNAEVSVSPVEPAPARRHPPGGSAPPFKPLRRNALPQPAGIDVAATPVGAVSDAPGRGETDAKVGGEGTYGTDEEALSGIALFPPPGTDPPKAGLIVPEDFELPPGFVRHHQVTDDGKQLPAILMFHPDFDWVDEKGQPLELPEDKIVPPELAPPGLPIEILEIPETHIEVIEEPDTASDSREQ